MQYKPEMEAIQMTENSNVPPSCRVVMSNNPHIKRTRRDLIIILGVCLGFTLSSAIYYIVNEQNFGIGAAISECIIPLIFYGFGIFCAHRYSSLGLRIFAWINVVGLVFLTIGIVMLFFLSSPSVLMFTIAITAVIVSIILIIIIIPSFKLARFIDAN